jgi:hypothetical protein
MSGKTADEGCLHLDHLPTEAEAAAIREALAIRKRRHVSSAAMAQAMSALEQSRAAPNRIRIRGTKFIRRTMMNMSLPFLNKKTLTGNGGSEAI